MSDEGRRQAEAEMGRQTIEAAPNGEEMDRDSAARASRVDRLAAENRELRERVSYLESMLTEVVPAIGRPEGRGSNGSGQTTDSPTVLPSGGQSSKVVGKFSDSNGGVGVYGHNTAGSGTTYGIWGEVDSADGHGLYTPNDAKVDGTFSVGDKTPQETGGPIAKGVIRSDGFIRNAQGVANAEYFASGPSYDIEYENFSYNNQEYVTVVTPVEDAAMIDIGQSGVNPKKCVVEMFDETGSGIVSDFQFVTYKVTE